MQFITSKESQNVNDLLVLKSLLESEGINCRLKDELSTQVLKQLSPVHVELQVVDFDLEKVKLIMRESGEIFVGR